MISTKNIWKTFVTSNELDQALLPQYIAESWKYCSQANVNPYSDKATLKISQNKLLTLKNEMETVVSIVRHEINRLHEFFYVKKPLFILTDKEGVVIWREGHTDTRHLANSIDFSEGSIWTEEVVGTNAIGIALRTFESVTVETFQHFSKASHPFTCSSTPILDENNEVIACLNISTMEELTESKFTLMALQMIAKNVQQHISLSYYRDKRLELLNQLTTPFVKSVLCDEKQRIVGLSNDCDMEESAWLGKHMSCFIAEYDDPYFMKELKDKEAIKGYSYQFPRKHKELTYVTFGIQSKNHQYQIFLNQLLRAANSDLPIHVYGETGSGKEVSAKTIHYNSQRHKGRLISVNCGALSEDLLESELFGYVPGAFTGAQVKGYKGKIEQAHGGTLFLDEVDSMSKRMQVALLRALEEKKVTPIGSEEAVTSDFRIVTASNKNLKDLVHEGGFREDLFYRLYVIPLTLPPLRERREDIQELAHQFCLTNEWEPHWLAKVLTIAAHYEWTGNIREFHNFLNRLHVFYPVHCPSDKKIHEMIQVGSVLKPPRISSLETLTEKEQIIQILKETNFHMSQTAERLGIARSTLYRKLNKYNITYDQ